MNTVEINLLNTATMVTGGLVKSDLLYEKAGMDSDEQWLYLNKNKDIDIPLLSNEYIIIHGGEKILAGDINTEIGKNPAVRNPVHLQLNGARLETGIKTAKLSGIELRKLDTELDTSKLFADLSDQVDACIQDDWVLVIQEKDCYLTIPVGDNETIDLEECAQHDRKPPKGQKYYKIKIDGDKYKVDKPELTGQEILGLVGKDYQEWTLNQKFRGGRRKPVEEDQDVDFSQPGIERFETIKKQAQQGLMDNEPA